jgi:hypothetical protein
MGVRDVSGRKQFRHRILSPMQGPAFDKSIGRQVPVSLLWGGTTLDALFFISIPSKGNLRPGIKLKNIVRYW